MRTMVSWAAALLLIASPVSAQVVRTTHDRIPDFSASFTVASVAAGAWSNPSTWMPARVPTAADVVRIRHAVTFDASSGEAGVIGIEARGALRFVRTQSTTLTVGTLIILANGTLEVGTETNPVPAPVTAAIVIKDRPLDPSTDPEQFGTGILTVNGTITMHGAAKDPTWVRVADEPRAGARTLSLEQAATGWQVGDLLVVPDSRDDPTRNNDAQLERLRIQSLSADGRTVTLSAPLAYDHPGARDLNGGIVLLPHVMNLTRNVVVRSENPTGTRGHTLHTNRAEVDIRYVEFRDLGRTTISMLDPKRNHIGRYALHVHHVFGPAAAPVNGYVFTLVGNALHDTAGARSRIKWPLTLHNSHYGLVRGNAVYNAGGAGIATEEGNESFNVIERNMVARVLGEGDRLGTKADGVHEPGSQGIGLWFHGPNNYVRDNVAVNSIETQVESGYGFEIFQFRLGDIRVPKFKGANTAADGQYTLTNAHSLPILEFSGNEAYGNPQGLTYWWLGIEFHSPRSTMESIFRETRLWHISRTPVYGYHGNKVTFDGLQVYGDRSVSGCCRTFWFGDYRNIDTTIRRATIVGIEALSVPHAGLGTTTVEDSFIATTWGIANGSTGAPGDCPNCKFPGRSLILRNVRFAALPGSPLRSITMSYTTRNGLGDLDSRDEVFVYDYQGQSGNDFRVYYGEQATQNIAGGLAPCRDATSRPEVAGITCAMTSSPRVPAVR